MAAADTTSERPLDVVPPGVLGPAENVTARTAALLVERAEIHARHGLVTAFEARAAAIAIRVNLRGEVAPVPRADQRGPVSEDIARVTELFDRMGRELDAVGVVLPMNGNVRPWDLGAKRRRATALRRTEQAEAIRAKLRGLVERTGLIAQEFEGETAELLAFNSSRLTDALGNLPLELRAWDRQSWSHWSPEPTERGHELLLGTAVEDLTGQRLGLPVVARWEPGNRPLVVVSRTATERLRAHDVLVTLTLRAATAAPRQVRFACLDSEPSHTALGTLRRRLEPSLPGVQETPRLLEDLVAEATRIEHTYLTPEFPSFAAVPRAMRLGEHERVLAVSSFPGALEPSSIDDVRSLIRSGARTGLSVFLHLDLEQAAAPALLEELLAAGAAVIEAGDTPVQLGPIAAHVAWAQPPSSEVQELVFQRLAATPRADTPVTWDDAQHLFEDEWWAEPADDLVSIPIGLAGADVVHDLWLGRDPDLGRLCEHGIVVGADAGERGRLFDSFIAGAATRYHPSELRLVLVEGPEHRSFAEWHGLPALQTLVTTPSPSQARFALSELRFEAERRLLECERRGLDSLAAGRMTGALAGTPRLVAVIDGFEQLFTDDVDEFALTELARLLEIGGRVGVHLLLGGSRFDATGPLQRMSLLERIPLRLALQLAPDDALGRDEFGVRGVRLVQAVCDRPGRAVMNTMAGAEDANLPVQLAVLTPERRSDLLVVLAERAAAAGIAEAPATVADGSQPPPLHANQLLTRTYAEAPAKRPAHLALVAQAGLELGGLGLDPWDAEERPLLGFLGVAEHLTRPAHLVLQRRPNEHVAVIMKRRDARTATVATLLAGALASAEPGGVRLHLVDRAPLGADAGGNVLETFAGLPGARFTRDSAAGVAWLNELGAEIAERRSRTEAENEGAPSEILVICEPDRLAALHLADAIAYVLANGPAVGVHLIVAAASLSQLRSVLPDQLLVAQVRHRVVTRLPDEDSFTVVRSPEATTLLDAPGRAPGGLLFDAHRQLSTRLVPHAATQEFGEELRALLGVTERTTEPAPEQHEPEHVNGHQHHDTGRATAGTTTDNEWM